MDLPETERAAFLAEVVRSDPSLRTEVMALWDEVDHTEGFLEEPAVAPPPSWPEGRDASFGPYRVVGELGEGGMGVVFLAERSDGQFTRRVAIKRVGSAAPGGDALRRFSDERQILARLDHPNITRLLDSGVDAAGVPYLVMEHVEGVAITSWCRQRKAPVRQRLGLFLKVCEAVQHAHRNLVIHRDIKPANILVSEGGEPKLLDFGIAKALGEATAGDATRTLNPALTLDFASPEQLRGQVVTTASDVYSLGVLLYDLLADRKPYEVGGHALADAVRVVCELTPPPPSQTAPAERRSELAGDLDAIVGKAMEKAPADRYGSVAELAADVSAHLDHLPVRARRPSFLYLGRKFVRRHRAGAAVAALVLALLAAGIAGVLWQARIAQRERDRAQQRFAQVQQLANYVIYDLHDGAQKLPGSTELRRQMVERSLAYLDSLASEATGDARLQTELAGAYSRLGDVLGKYNAANLGDRKGALAAYAKSRDLLRQVVSADPRNADARRSLGRLLLNIHQAHELEQPGAGARLLDEATAIWRDLVRDAPDHEGNLRGLASAHFSASIALQADPDQAARNLEQALAIFQKLLAASPEDPDRKRNVALCHKNLVGLVEKSDPARAHRHALEAAELDRQRLAAEPHNPQAKLDYSFDLSTLGIYHVGRGDYGEALRNFEEALVLRRDLWAQDRADVFARDRLAYMLALVAEVHVLSGDRRGAAPLLRESIEHARALPAAEMTTARTLTLAHLLEGEVALAAGRDPCPSHRRMAAQMARVPLEQQPWGLPSLAAMRDGALERLKTCSG
jgi:tetratricopeptide (TPR) repeat protein